MDNVIENGPMFRVSAEELRNAYKRKGRKHKADADKMVKDLPEVEALAKQLEDMKHHIPAQVKLQEVTTKYGFMGGGDPLKALQSQIKHHRKRQKFYFFASDHVPGEDQLLGAHELDGLL